jgi:hypothetical protein
LDRDWLDRPSVMAARPAVIGWSHGRAWSILAPGKDWTEVNAAEVSDSGAAVREDDWRDIFAAHFGAPDLAKIHREGST